MSDPSGDPVVTVVVPTFDRAERIGGLLPRLEELAADGAVEVVVVDDGSLDRTAEVLGGARHVQVVHQANAGAAAARNTGWRRARAPIVAFTDDDCVPAEGWPLDLLAPFADATVGGVGGRVTPTGAGAVDAFVAVERLVDHGRDLDDGGVDYLITANCAYRRALLEEVGGFDEAFPGAAGEDVDLAWRVRATGARLVRGEASVAHHHRTDLREVLRTYRGHGRSRARLDRRFPERGAAGSRSRVLSIASWRAQHRGYRQAGVGAFAALGLVGLRAAGLASFWWGWRTARRRG